MPKKAASAATSIADVLAELRKSEEPVGTLEDFYMTPEGYTTGNIALDAAIGCGGYPVGRIVEQFGPPSSGKTTSALQSLARAQQECIANGEGYVAFFDFEQSLDEKYCASLGLDVRHETFIYAQPLYFETGANVFRKLLATGELKMAVFDSVAAMITEKEASAETGAATVADRAKMMHQFLRQIKGECQQKGCTAVFLNHTMEKVDLSPMGQRMAAQGVKRWTQPGGQALPFYASVRIEFKQIGTVKTKAYDALTNAEDKRITQVQVQATVVKNKVARPHGTAELRVREGKGFSQPFSVLRILVNYNEVKVNSTGYYTFPDELAGQDELVGDALPKKIQGEDKVLTLIERNPGWLKILEKRAQELLDQHGVERVEESSIENEDGYNVDIETGEVTGPDEED